MKILIINGSPRQGGNSELLIKEMKKVFDEFNASYDVLNIGNKNIRGCIACGYCHEKAKCVFDDEVNIAAQLFKEADGLVLVSPVYYGSPNGTIISFLDRLFYSSRIDKRYKVGSAFAIARRGGTTASFDVLCKYFTISGMPIASGDYWNNAFGMNKAEVLEDKEGLRNARVVAKRMVFLIKAIKDAKSNYQEMLEDEKRSATNFIK